MIIRHTKILNFITAVKTTIKIVSVSLGHTSTLLYPREEDKFECLQSQVFEMKHHLKTLLQLSIPSENISECYI